jgi:MoaA/NifB/PqqE/SkfB family radical SAM enzyme
MIAEEHKVEDFLGPFYAQFLALRKWCGEARTPFSLTMELTPLCNFNCPMCYVHLTKPEMEKRGKPLSAAQWLGITRQFAEMGLFAVNMSGGEPLIRPDFWEIYEGVCRQGIYPSLFTNGALLDERAVEHLVKFPPRGVKLSLYGADNETYAAMCGDPHGFDKVSHAIDLLREAKIPLKVTSTLVKQNQSDLAKLQAYAQEKKIFLDITTGVNASARVTDNDPRDARLEDSIEDWSLKKLSGYKHKPIEKAFDNCSPYGCSGVVTWHGHLQVCAFFENDYVQLTEPYDIPAAWRELLQKSDAVRVPAECSGCPDAEFCLTCPGELVSECGRADGIAECVCRRAARIHAAYLKKQAEMPADTADGKNGVKK